MTLEMRLKPGFVQLWAGILDLYPTSVYFFVLFVRWDLYLSFKKCVLEHALDVIYNTARKHVFADGYWYGNKCLNVYFKRISFAFEFNYHMVYNNHWTWINICPHLVDQDILVTFA